MNTVKGKGPTTVLAVISPEVEPPKPSKEGGFRKRRRVLLKAIAAMALAGFAFGLADASGHYFGSVVLAAVGKHWLKPMLHQQLSHGN